MPTQTPTTTGQPTDGHIGDRIDAFLGGRLGTEAEIAFESHLVVCDSCFSTYLLRTVDRV